MKIAILGCDGSHSEVYAEIFKKRGYELFFWDSLRENSLNLSGFFPNSNIIDSLTELPEGLSFSIVVGRYVDSHYQPAKHSILRCIPTYIDKPGLETKEQALELVALANENRTPLIGFSPYVQSTEFCNFSKKILPFSKVVVSASAFCKIINHHKANDLSFYASHATDLLCSLTNSPIQTINCIHNSSSFWITVVFENGFIGVLNLLKESEEFYSLTAFNNSSFIDAEINPHGDMYLRTANYIESSLRSSFKDNHDFNSMVNSVDLINQIKINLGKDS